VIITSERKSWGMTCLDRIGRFFRRGGSSEESEQELVLEKDSGQPIDPFRASLRQMGNRQDMISPAEETQH